MPLREGEDYELFDPRKDAGRAANSTGRGFLYVGALLGLAGLGYMARNFKNKPKDMKFSVYLIHTRLVAQGTVVGVLSLGMLYQIYQRKLDK